MPSIPDTADLLSQLVACPSVNPGGSKNFQNFEGESGMVTLLEAMLSPWADDIEIYEVAPGRPNLIARFDGKDPSRAYALEAHTDTVGIDGMTIAPFKPGLREGRLYGRGACDTKGPMAAMLLALMGAKQAFEQLPVTWYFIATCDEELGGRGAQALVESGFRCDGIIVGEPTSLRPIHRNKGASRFAVTLHGKAGHSAYPESGINAIHAAAHYIRSLETAVDELKVSLADCPTGPLTLSVGTIRGGDQVNRIPDQTTLEVDVRVPTPCKLADVLQVMESARAETTARFPGLSIEARQTQHYPPYAFCEDTSFQPIVDTLEPESPGERRSARYATNAGFYSTAEIPCLVYGPGDIAQAHTADEWIEIAAIEAAAKHLQACILTS